MHQTKAAFLQRARETLDDIYSDLQGLADIPLTSFSKKTTALVVIDMVNGFVKSGPMSSGRVEKINVPIAALTNACAQEGFKIVALCDSHTEQSPEFSAYPPHCLKGDEESEITDEIKASAPGRILRIDKASTNGFLEPAFQNFLSDNGDVDTFLLVGDCTDLCVLQFALALKTDFNRRDKKCRVVVPAGLVETYELGAHNAELMNLFALYNLSINGIELVKEITF